MRGNARERRAALRTAGRFAGFALMVVFACTVTVPFLWMSTASLKPRSETESPHLVPRQSRPSNYLVVLRLAEDPHLRRLLDLHFPKWYFNSVFVATWVTTLQVLTSAMAAYAFSRVRWPGRDKVFLLYLATMMIPGLVLMVPNYQIMVTLRLINSYSGLIIPAAFSAFGTFLLRQFMMTIPPSLDEAAEIDGANHMQIFLDVILPLARPGVVTLTIFTFLGNYRSFFWPLVMIKDDHLRTLPIGMLSFQDSYGNQTEYLMAATVMCILPLIVLFIVMQKQLVRGIQLGAVKG
ncbi:MAG TPA: carbohydrate ABC transporter permease [Candidatus Brocadiia bacterium]|nr:carbohydrate ABC transporter permease [Candidatus Brocadiia bacterium]